jgi:hypothetical protein
MLCQAVARIYDRDVATVRKLNAQGLRPHCLRPDARGKGVILRWTREEVVSSLLGVTVEDVTAAYCEIETAQADA